MTSVPACPYCNAALPPRSAAPTQPQTPCPRCGEPVASERFPATGADRDVADAASSSDGTQRKQRTLRTVVAIMCGMGVLALVFALWTRQIRRDRDPKPVPEPAEDLAQRPADLLALGYLPTGTNIALGIQVAALSKDPDGRALLREPRPAPFGLVTNVLDLAGLTLADVNHFVAGSELKSLSFQITTVIVTRQPYRSEQVKAAVVRHKVHATTYRGGELVRFADLPGVPKLWCAAPRVLVYTTLPTAALDRITAKVKEPASTLTPAARQALSDRLNKQSRIWAVADLAPAKELIDTLQLFPGPFKDQVRLLSVVRTFTLGVAVREAGTVSLTGDFYTGVPAATKQVRKYLESVQLPGAKSQKVESPPPDIDAAEAQWVAWQVRMSTDSLRMALDTLPVGSRKENGAGK